MVSGPDRFRAGIMAALEDVESLPRGGFRCRLCHVPVANNFTGAREARNTEEAKLLYVRREPETCEKTLTLRSWNCTLI
ncbi:speckle targeted PIP5K1A-regulated poly(A) polymerase-like [Hemicordylus capensis]|uniref:speckle targeted PIP5K1A-regulated poly(A) polymerase-like n=1 Tax=Hemicordylus capensis TaxID=884348 RepID=UPI0023042A48|nr:speckle targeted PIP5K1A-regulated poly(A) polymerase-like [Hemicordylus capensis]